MKNGWQTKALGDLCEVIGGGTPSKDRPTYYSGDIPWATVRDMKQDVITETEFRITNKAVEESSTNIIPARNVVIATRVGLGKVCLLGQDTAINQDLRGIIPRNKNILETRYLYWWFKSISDVIIAEGTGATVQGVKLPFVKSLQIPTPPLADQRRLVQKLDDAFAGIAKAKENAEKNLQNARALFESHLDSVFNQRGPGWVEKQLGEVADVQSGGTPSVPEKTYWGGIIPWYSSGELNEIHTTDPERTITDAGLNNSNAKLFPKGSLLIGMYDTAALKMSILDRDGTYNQAIAGVKPNERIEIEFVLHAINAVKPRLLLERRGVRQMNLSLGKIKEIAIPLPTPTEQRAVISRLREILKETQRLARLYEQKLEAFESLRKSILHEAFSGNL